MRSSPTGWTMSRTSRYIQVCNPHRGDSLVRTLSAVNSSMPATVSR
jgi:hypothetical protein